MHEETHSEIRRQAQRWQSALQKFMVLIQLAVVMGCLGMCLYYGGKLWHDNSGLATWLKFVAFGSGGMFLHRQWYW